MSAAILAAGAQFVRLVRIGFDIEQTLRIVEPVVHVFPSALHSTPSVRVDGLAVCKNKIGDPVGAVRYRVRQSPGNRGTAATSAIPESSAARR